MTDFFLNEGSNSDSSSWLAHRNVTSSNNDNQTYDGGAATIFLLSLLILVTITASILCINVDRLRKRSSTGRQGTNSASDGNTVASLDDLEDGKGLEEGDKNMDLPIVIIVEDTE